LNRRLGQKYLNKESETIFKKGVLEKSLELFSLEKRQGQGSGATGPARWKNGSRHWAEMKKN
jgi:hypothetical protein